MPLWTCRLPAGSRNPGLASPLLGDHERGAPDRQAGVCSVTVSRPSLGSGEQLLELFGGPCVLHKDAAAVTRAGPCMPRLSSPRLFSRSLVRSHGCRELPEGPAELSALSPKRRPIDRDGSCLPAPLVSLLPRDPLGRRVTAPLPLTPPGVAWDLRLPVVSRVCGALALKLSVTQAVEGLAHTWEPRVVLAH